MGILGIYKKRRIPPAEKRTPTCTSTYNSVKKNIYIKLRVQEMVGHTGKQCEPNILNEFIFSL